MLEEFILSFLVRSLSARSFGWGIRSPYSLGHLLCHQMCWAPAQTWTDYYVYSHYAAWNRTNTSRLSTPCNHPIAARLTHAGTRGCLSSVKETKGSHYQNKWSWTLFYTPSHKWNPSGGVYCDLWGTIMPMPTAFRKCNLALTGPHTAGHEGQLG